MFREGQGSPHIQAALRAIGCVFTARVGGTEQAEPGTSFEVLSHLFHSKVTILKLPASISSGGCFPVWSQQDKTLRRAEKGAALRGQREKLWAYACPKCHLFGGLALGILAVSMPARLGAELRSPKAQTRDGAGATSEHGDQGTGVSVQEGAQEPSTLSLQSANRSLCILFLSFPSFCFRPIFLVTN